MLDRGLDVSLKQTALCVVDGDGRVVREAKLATDPEVISRFLQENELGCERIGLESGGTSSWLCLELRRLGHPAVCIDARHAAAALQAGFRNKNDRNDARGIAELMRVRTFREVWIKSQESQRRGMLLTARGDCREIGGARPRGYFQVYFPVEVETAWPGL